MVDKELIPAEQLKRLLVQTDHRGMVTSAQVIDDSLLAKWIEIEVLPAECMEYSRTYQQWKRQVFRMLDAKTSSFDSRLGDNGNEIELYSELRRIIPKRDLDVIENFLPAHVSFASGYWKNRYVIRDAFDSLIKSIDAVRNL